MPKRWLIVIIISVVTLVLWTGLEIFFALMGAGKDGVQIRTVTKIDNYLGEDILDEMGDAEQYVLVDPDSLQPKSSTTGGTDQSTTDSDSFYR